MTFLWVLVCLIANYGSHERRFKCTNCGIKWFVPAAAVRVPDPTACEACGGRLIPLRAGSQSQIDVKSEYRRGPRSPSRVPN